MGEERVLGPREAGAKAEGPGTDGQLLGTTQLCVCRARLVECQQLNHKRWR